jgi:hypothetical protein
MGLYYMPCVCGYICFTHEEAIFTPTTKKLTITSSTITSAVFSYQYGEMCGIEIYLDVSVTGTLCLTPLSFLAPDYMPAVRGPLFIFIQFGIHSGGEIGIMGYIEIIRIGYSVPFLPPFLS